MPRWTLLALLVVGVICAGVGTSLLDPVQAASFGWTAYAPLSRSIHSGNAVYMPIDPTWLQWRPRIGAALLALGAGSTGAALVALLTSRQPRS